MSESNNNEIYNDALPDAALEFSSSIMGEIKHQDVLYICDHIYPFLQVASPMHSLANAELNMIEAKNGWKMIDYGDVLCASAPHDKNNSMGNGTIVQQQFDVAFEMMELIKQRHWGKASGGADDEGGAGGESGEGELKPAAAQILGGTPMMQRFAWFAAKALGINLEGFAPTEEDQKWLEKLYDKYVAQEKTAGKEILNSKF